MKEGRPIKLNGHLIQTIDAEASRRFRSRQKQIEFWLNIGRLAEMNPTLTFEDLLDRLADEKPMLIISSKAGAT